MSLNDAIRRARPTVDSPLADLIAGKIDQAEYRRRLIAKRLREDGALTQRLMRPLMTNAIGGPPTIPRRGVR